MQNITSTPHSSSDLTLDTSDTVGPLYANVGQVEQHDGRQVSRSTTLPAGSRAGDVDYDNVSTSGKEKKGSVLGRFLGRKNK